MKQSILIREKDTGEIIACYPRTVLPGDCFKTPYQDFELSWQFAVMAELVEEDNKDKYQIDLINVDDLYLEQYQYL